MLSVGGIEMALKTFKGILGVHDDISELRYVEDSKKYLDCLTSRYCYPGCITCNCGIVKKRCRYIYRKVC